ncbi:sporulation protein YqfC [Paenibacillus yanchengensis]|uniref:Sporulation protein YqfC n=1 Tax=Paenibacillus yanchengensis TaxID=2035833 RepID=A0ABW4YKF8_9BACL
MATQRWRKKLSKATAELLDMPQDVVYDLPRVTVIGDRQLYIENHRGVIHFSDEVLQIALNSGQLEISGEALVIRTIWTDEVFVEGVIHNIRFIPPA